MNSRCEVLSTRVLSRHLPLKLILVLPLSLTLSLHLPLPLLLTLSLPASSGRVTATRALRHDPS